MDVSSPSRGRPATASNCIHLCLGLLTLVAAPAQGQDVPAVFEGVAYVGRQPLDDGVVVLHHLSEGQQGDLDSMRVQGDGSFRFVLPAPPDPSRSDIYFASYRHQGVLYFSAAVTSTIQLDSVYSIQAWDTLLAPAEGADFPLQSRSVFFEPDTVGWVVTDLFQLRNEQPRTVVARDGGVVWSHALPAEATDVIAGEGELSPGAVAYENGGLAVRAALSPGERIFVVRYRVESPLISIPVEGPAEVLDVLVREPAPAVEVEGLELTERIELEAGSTYQRFTGTEVDLPEVRVVQGAVQAEPQVEWVAFLLAMVLAGSGLFILRPGRGQRPEVVTVGGGADRSAIVERIALLDEDFEAQGKPESGRAIYERKRAELLRQLAILG